MALVNGERQPHDVRRRRERERFPERVANDLGPASGLDASLPGTLAIARSVATSSGASSGRALRIESASATITST